MKEADERLERRYPLEAEGYDLDQVTKRVADVMNIEPDLILEKSRRPQVLAARDLLCFWASKELGMRATDLAKRLNLTQPALSIGVRQGEKIAIKNKYQLMGK